MQVIWNSNFIILSVLVAITGSFTALAHARRMRESAGATQKAWLLAGGVTLGMTVWAMHFIGMLALHLPIPVSYDIFLTLTSIFPVIAAALLGFYLLQSIEIKIRQIVIGGIFMGIGIALMHYIGMAALKMQPAISYNLWLFALSVLIAIVAATSALLIVYFNEKTKLPALLQHLISAIIMGIAIAGMHYTGMASASFMPNSICITVKGLNIAPALIAMLITVSMLILFGGGWIANLYERRVVLDELRIVNKKLKLSDEALRVAANAFEVQEAVMITDANDIVLRTNQSFTKLTGYNVEEVVGKPSGIFQFTYHDAAFFQSMRDALAQDKTWAGEVYDIRKDGSSYLKRLAITAVSNNTNEITNYVVSFADISQLREAQEQVQLLAFYDPLTKLPNRRLLLDRQELALATSVRNKKFGAVLFIDLDNFKVLNDTKGHAVGDLMLIEVASRLRDNLRAQDTVARIGGDEFVIVLEGLGEELTQATAQARLVGEKIRNCIDQPYSLQGYEFHSTVSIGVSLFHGNNVGVEDLFKYADSAMYQSKQAGRNMLNFYDPSMQAVLEARSELEIDLRQALAQQQLSLYYQMQVDSNRHIFGAEVLLRWHHPVRGLVSPLQFIALAEETGLILPIGHFVLEAACKQLKAWQENALADKILLAVNVSARQFQQADFVDQVREVLAQTGANPHLLKLELTESMVMDNITDTIAKMQTLRLLGVRFAMDDFGTGYSSLSALKRLPITQLKIDQSFVRDITDDTNDIIIVKTIIGMANSLEMNVIAEGVETEAQLKLLQQCHCHAFQGYLFSKPVPLEAFEQLLSKHKLNKKFDLRLATV